MLIPSNGFVTLFTLNLGIAYFVVNCVGFHMLESSNITRIKRQATNCRPFYFKCNSGECISNSKLCDGVAHCTDASDETTRCQQISCPDFAIRCAYGACIEATAKCNNVRDCVDGSDEVNCGPTTTTNNNCGTKYACKNGQCISQYLVCDGKKHCDDGSDETFETCNSIPCQEYSFRCSYGACVDGDAKCNGQVECVDGSDEAPDLCGKVTPTPPLTPTPTTDGCVIPQQPSNGKYEGVPKEVRLYPGQVVNDGTILVFRCNYNYALPTMKPMDSVFCLNKQWTKRFPTCIRTCPPRISDSVDIQCEYDDKNINCSLPMLEGTRVTMKCKHNYESTDISARNPVSVCFGGSWDYNIIKCVPGCGKITAQGETNIVHGGSTKLGAFPWHVGVYMKDEDTNKFEQVCGGSLIAMNIVISAAHCFADDNGGALNDISPYLIAAGKYYRDLNDPRDKKTIQQSAIRQVNITSDYKGVQTSFRDDIAVVVLETPFKVTHIVQPVCVDWAHQYEDQQLYTDSYGDVVGWGFTESQGNPSEELKHLQAPFIENKRCYDVLPISFYPYITSDKFCVGYTNGSSVCRGDSGGGLAFLRKENTKYYIRGVVSTGPKVGFGCDPHKYSLFTKISVFMNMISKIEALNRIDRNLN